MKMTKRRIAIVVVALLVGGCTISLLASGDGGTETVAPTAQSDGEVAPMATVAAPTGAPAPTTVPPTAVPPTATPPTATPVQPDVEVTVEQLLKAYDENELAADQVYKGKVAAITGTVESVNEMLGRRFVVLKPDYLSISGVRCYFEREHVEQLVKLKKEQVVTLQGKIDGYGLASVTVENCAVESEIPASDAKPASVVTSESGVIEVTVEQLVKAYEANELAADQVYKGKVAAITGTVESVNEMLGRRFVVLKPDYLSIIDVSCYFEREHIEQLVELKKDQVVTLQGEIDGYGLARVEVENCTVKPAA